MRSNIIRRTFASSNTVSMAVLTFTKSVIVLGFGTLSHTKWTVFDMFTLFTVPWSWTCASDITLTVALVTCLVATLHVKALGGFTRFNTFRVCHEVLATETELIARSPTAFTGALRITNVTLKMTFLWSFVVLKQGVVGLRLHDGAPVDVLRVTQVIVLQYSHTSRSDHVQGFKIQRLQGCLDNIQGTEVLGQMSATNNLQISEC